MCVTYKKKVCSTLKLVTNHFHCSTINLHVEFSYVCHYFVIEFCRWYVDMIFSYVYSAEWLYQECWTLNLKDFRSSHPEEFCKTGVLRNFARASFLIKLQTCNGAPATLLKKWIWHRCFPVNFAKFLREGYTAKFFFQSIPWNSISGSFHETWNTFMK